MPQSRVARQSNDIILKLVATTLGGDLFRRFGISLPPIVAAFRFDYISCPKHLRGPG